jgi:hypothetical protein
MSFSLQYNKPRSCWIELAQHCLTSLPLLWPNPIDLNPKVGQVALQGRQILKTTALELISSIELE